MNKQFDGWLSERKYFTNKDRVLIALSGGVDSVVLTHLLYSLPLDRRPQLFLAHVNHHLRQASDLEQEFVMKWAKALELPLFIYEWSPSSHPTTNIEQAARDVRYSFFERMMQKEKIDYLVTAHHQDDQVETILMRLFQGKSLELLTGIPEVSRRNQRTIIRPLLPFKKNELYSYARHHQLTYYEDATNFESIYYRNFVRTQIIPPLKKENPKFNEHMIQFKEELEQLLEIRDIQLAQMSSLKKIYPDYLHLNSEKLKEYPVSIQKSFLQELLINIYKDNLSRMKNNYTEIVWQYMLQGEIHTEIHLGGGLCIYKTYDCLYFYNKDQKPDVFKKTGYQEWILHPNQWIQLTTNEKIGLFPAGSIDIPPYAEVLEIYGGVEFPLVVRNRKKGDRMQIQGLKGTKKIKDILIDEKIPLHLRDKKWIISDQTDRIIWLISIRKAEILVNTQVNTGLKHQQLIYIDKKRR